MGAEAEPPPGPGSPPGDDAGHRIYTPLFLRVYDPLVLGFYSNRVWGCPPDRLLDHYDRHIGRRHLDVGPGTGYFLERARLPGDAAVTLLDPNPNVLAPRRPPARPPGAGGGARRRPPTPAGERTVRLGGAELRAALPDRAAAA